MTLFVFEGPSRSGKSTIRDILEDQYVIFKGENLMRKGVGDNWIAYRERYHEFLHRLYELNPGFNIIADRAFSDGVYNPRPDVREDMLRLYACYGDVHIVYFYPGSYDDGNHSQYGRSILMERGTRDAYHLDEILDRYETLLGMFPHVHINTDAGEPHECAQHVDRYIERVSGGGPDPDV